MKKLEKILESIKVLNVINDPTRSIADVQIDSRKCKASSLFIAYQGYNTDSHAFIKSAIERGASCIVLDNEKYLGEYPVQYVLVPNSQRVISRIAANYYDHPSREMTVVGVTGTNGKTTTTNLLYNLFFRLEHNCALISTIEVLYDDKVIPSKLTTPDAISLQSLFRRMSETGVTEVFMEVSSHALSQGRVADVDFDLAVFTNLTHDHLDYHKTFKDYLNSKKLLFDKLSAGRHCLVNIDDVNGKVMSQNSKAEVHTYALRKPADFKGKIVSNTLMGLQMLIGGHEVFLRMVGGFNGYNAVATYGTAILLGKEESEVLQILSTLVTAEGRLDMIKVPDVGYTAAVDYAHTPDALEKVLKTLVEAKDKQVKLITVVGCGGDRDKKKRPMMAKVAALYSDQVILTSDNPRSEVPEDIIADMVVGISEKWQDKVQVIVNREEAIAEACAVAETGDIILVAGKGHEKYQEIKGKRFPFDDKKILKAHMS